MNSHRSIAAAIRAARRQNTAYNYRAFGDEAVPKTPPKTPPQSTAPTPPAAPPSDSLHSKDIAFKPTDDGWGFSPRFSANYDAIFKKKSKASGANDTTPKNKPEAKKADFDSIFGKSAKATAPLNPSDVLTQHGLELLRSDREALMKMLAASR